MAGTGESDGDSQGVGRSPCPISKISFAGTMSSDLKAPFGGHNSAHNRDKEMTPRYLILGGKWDLGGDEGYGGRAATTVLFGRLLTLQERNAVSAPAKGPGGAVPTQTVTFFSLAPELSN